MRYQKISGVLLGVFAAVSIGCASSPAVRSSASAIASISDHQKVEGSWDLVSRTVDRDGDVQIDRQLLQLHQRGHHVLGIWDRARDWIPHRCTVRRRELVVGKIATRGVELEVAKKLPATDTPTCVGKLPELSTCQIARVGKTLDLRCGKKTYEFARRAEPSLPLTVALGGGQLTGVWTWHHRSVDRDGDLKIEHERWHLTQNGRTVEGFYDRYVAIRSRDGRPFRCNEALGYRNAARFRVRGVIQAGKVLLREVSYVTRPGSCETGRRSLDRYIGILTRTGAGSAIQLRWKNGAQLLRKR
jgi:hypothetical protein